MSKDNSSYNNPLTGRYAGKVMSGIWSPQFKHSTWRRLWLTLAKCEKELGLPIKYIGVGEKADDMEPFDAKDFVSALFD